MSLSQVLDPESSWITSMAHNPLLWLLTGLVALHTVRLLVDKAGMVCDRVRGYISHYMSMSA